MTRVATPEGERPITHTATIAPIRIGEDEDEDAVCFFTPPTLLPCCSPSSCLFTRNEDTTTWCVKGRQQLKSQASNNWNACAGRRSTAANYEGNYRGSYEGSYTGMGYVLDEYENKRRRPDLLHLTCSTSARRWEVRFGGVISRIDRLTISRKRRGSG